MSRLSKGIAALLVVWGVAGAGYWLWQQDLNKPLVLEQAEIISIPTGSSGHSVLRTLTDRGWLQSHPLAVKAWLKLRFSSRSVKAGTYQILPDMTVTEMFSLLDSGQEHQFNVSLVEGLTLQEWIRVLKQHPYVEDDLSEEKVNHLQQQWFGAEELNSLEGVLLADTYYFTAHTSISTILQRSMNAMEQYLSGQWSARAVGLPIETPYEALILASIVEKETAVGSERARIAGVFSNRLEMNMRLQTDPTVIYGIGDTFDGNLTRAHLRQKTAFNTYVIKGLPPTPIAMAGREAIHAALNPLPTDELYFVSKGDGSHHFSTTLEEHNQAVYQYQIKPTEN